MEPEWAADLRTDAVEGITTGAAEPIHGGSALSLSLEADRGTVPAGEIVSLFPLDPSLHSGARRVQAGDQVRVTGLWRRGDESVVATMRTIITAVDCLPVIAVDPGGP